MASFVATTSVCRNECVQILTHFDNIPVFLSAQKCLWKEILLQIQVTYLCVA